LDEQAKLFARDKRIKIIAKASAQVQEYNSLADSVEVQPHLDPQPVAWIKPSQDFVVGDQVSRISNPEFQIFQPMAHRGLNAREYPSIQWILQDLRVIWTVCLEQELNISRKEFKEYHVLLVIPDLCVKVHLRLMIDVLIKEMGFAGIMLHNESVCSSFGAGVSSSCVVDIGAQSISISCVDEGLIVKEASYSLKYGGQDVTRVFARLLQDAKFPLELNVDDFHDFQLVDGLKQKYCSVNGGDLTINVGEFYARRPGKTIMRYTFKMYDETLKAPLVKSLV
jgi:actin-related protein 8